jgi:hypothetical protein
MSFQSENERNKTVVDAFYQLDRPGRQGHVYLGCRFRTLGAARQTRHHPSASRWRPPVVRGSVSAESRTKRTLNV